MRARAATAIARAGLLVGRVASNVLAHIKQGAIPVVPLQVNAGECREGAECGRRAE